MKPIKSRTLSLLAVTLVYVIAVAGGIAAYRALPYDFWLSLLIADAAATVIVFVFSVVFGNASVYDPYWSVQPPVILAAFALGSSITPFKVMLLAVVLLWAVRLTANWVYTFHSFEYQDWRYVMLKEKTGIFYPVINFVGIHMVPTLIVYACTLPAVFVLEEGADPGVTGFLFLLVSLLAVVLQGTADVQMHRFRKKRTGGFIRTGLWKYSRHPNYLAEILMWWGVALAAVCSMPDRWYLCIGALLNTLLFLFVSIPMADGRQSRKSGFEEYRKQTRMLLPIKK
ncbi:MAG: DUF1295 domain-containing protein [Clostridia bacterium]|nr:DUF1295 domain-containing protein [Clostridia bacterium]